MKFLKYRIIEIFKQYGKKWDKLTPTQKEKKELLKQYGLGWYKDSPEAQDTIQFAHKNINAEPNADEQPTWYYLAHFGDEVVNKHFREDRPDKDDLKIIDEIRQINTKCDMVVYRGVHEEIFKLMLKNAKKLQNTDLFEKSVMQTCLIKGAEIDGDYNLRIYIPKGSNAVYLGNVNDEQYWFEVDIQTGAKLRILSADSHYINCMLIGTN